MTSTIEQRRSSSARPARRRGRVIAVTGATAAASAVWIVARLAGSTLTVSMPGQAPMAIGLPVVVFTALVAALAGWGLLAGLERLTHWPRTLWTVVAVVALLASFGPPALADTSTGSRIALVLMHLAVAAVLIPGLRRTTRARGDTR